MSRNLVKQYVAVVQDEEKRIIDSNKLIQQRMDELAARKQAANGGFVSGLAADEIELSEDEEAAGGNVIKARDDANQILEQAQADASAILADARAQALQLREESKAQAEMEKNHILIEARQQGYAEGFEQAQMENEAVKREYLEKERQMEEYYQKQIDELEPRLVDTVTEIYQHIFNVELQPYRYILTHLISTTLRKIEGGRDFMIHVSKEDYSYVNMQKKQILAEGAVSANFNVEVIEDVTLDKNQCMIETESGIYDCGLGTQLEELKQKLMLLAWTKED